MATERAQPAELEVPRARSVFLAVAAIAHALLGGLALVAPPLVADLFGAALPPGGEAVARLLGATLVGFAIALFAGRSADERTARALLVAGLVVSGLSLAVVAVAIADGVMEPRAWAGAAVRLALALGFAWLAFAPSRART